MEYNQGTAEWLELRIDFNAASDITISTQECRAFFDTIIDGCDGNNPDNPFNFKHGGSFPVQARARMRRWVQPIFIC